MDDSLELQEMRQKIALLERRVEKSETELQDFLYIVSHDFRGPLRAIMAAGMILMEDHQESLDKDGRAELKRQSDAAKKLNRMLEELLKLSRLNRRALEAAPLDLGAMCLAIASTLGISESQVSLSGDLRISADEELAEQLLTNLLENSVKFKNPQNDLHITLGRDEGEFYLTDNGIGMDPERISRIFLPFERLNGDEYPGLGIGLATASRIVSRHGGTLSAESTLGEGATFRFSLTD